MANENRTKNIDWEARMDAEKITPFQRRVYKALLEVPRGRVTTYADLGKYIGCKSPRAIGSAMRRNPFAPQVPCHRVIASGGKIGGFHGHRYGSWIKRKRVMLHEEGVEFDENDTLHDSSKLWSWS